MPSNRASRTRFELSPAVIERVIAELGEKGRHQASPGVATFSALSAADLQSLVEIAPYEALTVRQLALVRLMLDDYGEADLEAAEAAVHDELADLERKGLVHAERDRFQVQGGRDARLYLRYAAQRLTGRKLRYGRSYPQAATVRCATELARVVAREGYEDARVFRQGRPHEVGGRMAGRWLDRLVGAAANKDIVELSNVLSGCRRTYYIRSTVRRLILRSAISAVLTVLTVALGPAGANGAVRARPNLQLMYAPSVPAVISGGTQIRLGDVAHNSGGGRSVASITRLQLSRDKRPSRSDRFLPPVVRHPALRVRRSSLRRATITIPARREIHGRYHLIACADARRRVRESREHDNCRASRAFVVRSTSSDLIAAARRTGRLSSERAILYGVFAAFGDARLPARYRGASRLKEPNPLVHEAVMRYGELSPRTRRQLRPMLVPPPTRDALRAHPTAPVGETPCGRVPPAHEAAHQWKAVTANSGVAFWYRVGTARTNADRADAERLARVIDARLWKLTEEMQRGPHPDSGLDCFTGNSSGLDVYLMNELESRDGRSVQGLATPYYCDTSKPAPMFLQLYRRDVSVLAHELMHAIQYAFRCFGLSRPLLEHWFVEGMARWAQLHLGTLRPPRPAKFLLESRQLQDYAYDAWIWWWWAAKKNDGADTIRQALYAVTIPAFGEVVHATDLAVGSFKKRWPQFIRETWNRAPVAPSFRASSWLGDRAAPPEHLTPLALGGAPRAEVIMREAATYLPPLGRNYTRYRLTDNKIRLVSAEGQPKLDGYRMHALLRARNGSWREEDWTAGGSFCNEGSAPADIVEIVIITSNSALDAGVEPARTPRFNLADDCSGADLYGVTFDGSGNSTSCDVPPSRTAFRWHVTFTAFIAWGESFSASAPKGGSWHHRGTRSNGEQWSTGGHGSRSGARLHDRHVFENPFGTTSNPAPNSIEVFVWPGPGENLGADSDRVLVRIEKPPNPRTAFSVRVRGGINTECRSRSWSGTLHFDPSSGFGDGDDEPLSPVAIRRTSLAPKPTRGD